MTPWIWLANLDGALSVAGRRAGFDLDTGELLDALEFGLMLYGEARRDDIGFFIQPRWVPCQERSNSA